MLGTVHQLGIMGLTLDALFTEIQNRKNADYVKYSVTLSYLEVYNENIRDLLAPSGEYLDLREDSAKGVVVAGITELAANSVSEVMNLLRQGNKNRTTEPTAANRESSRSHAVLQVIVEARDQSADISHSVRVGKLSLIDLAGSERAANTQNRGIRMFEGANINRSLLALANCINALGEMAKNDNSLAFIPYRDSKLTRLLKDSLGGNSRTVMIANISPSAFSFEETHNTLKYSNRAKNIKTKINRNVKSVEYHISQYQHIITELRDEISLLRNQLANNASQMPTQIDLHVDKSFHRVTPDPFQEILIGDEIAIVEQTQFDRIQARLTNNFASRFQLKQSIITIEGDKLRSMIQMNSFRLQIDEQIPDSSVAQTELDNIQETIRKSEEMKIGFLNQFNFFESEAKMICEEIDKSLSHPILKTFLHMQSNMQEMQLEYMELEQSSLLQQIVIKQRDLSMMKLETQIKLRDNVINEQIAVLKNHRISDLEMSSPSSKEISKLTVLHKESIQEMNLTEYLKYPLLNSNSKPPIFLPEVKGDNSSMWGMQPGRFGARLPSARNQHLPLPQAVSKISTESRIQLPEVSFVSNHVNITPANPLHAPAFSPSDVAVESLPTFRADVSFEGMVIQGASYANKKFRAFNNGYIDHTSNHSDAKNELPLVGGVLDLKAKIKPEELLFKRLVKSNDSFDRVNGSDMKDVRVSHPSLPKIAHQAPKPSVSKVNAPRKRIGEKERKILSAYGL